MYSKYIVLLNKNVPIPSRTSIVEHAWGKGIPVSFIQFTEVLNDASSLDIKVNKWEVNSKWSKLQDEEPWIRVEIFRNERITECIRDKQLRIIINNHDCILVTLELDDGWQEIDLVMLALMVKAFETGHKFYGYDDVDGYIDCSDTLKSLPPKSVFRKSLYIEE